MENSKTNSFELTRTRRSEGGNGMSPQGQSGRMINSQQRPRDSALPLRNFEESPEAVLLRKLINPNAAVSIRVLLQGFKASPEETKDDKPFMCKFCHDGFDQHYQLKYHYIVHHPARYPYTCFICQQGFYQFDDLMKHQNVHLPSEPSNYNNPSNQVSSDHTDNERAGHLGIFATPIDLTVKNTRAEPEPLDLSASTGNPDFASSTNHFRPNPRPNIPGISAAPNSENRDYSVPEPDTTASLFAGQLQPALEKRSQIPVHLELRHWDNLGFPGEGVAFHVDRRRKLYKCIHCSKVCRKLSSVRSHLNVWNHEWKNPFKCDLCCKSYEEEILLNKHMRVYHRMRM